MAFSTSHLQFEQPGIIYMQTYENEIGCISNMCCKENENRKRMKFVSISEQECMPECMSCIMHNSLLKSQGLRKTMCCRYDKLMGIRDRIAKSNTYIHACIHSYIQPYMHTYLHIYAHAYIHAYIHSCTHIHTCIPLSVLSILRSQSSASINSISH